jgi:hypothetical protein
LSFNKIYWSISITKCTRSMVSRFCFILYSDSRQCRRENMSAYSSRRLTIVVGWSFSACTSPRQCLCFCDEAEPRRQHISTAIHRLCSSFPLWVPTVCFPAFDLSFHRIAKLGVTYFLRESISLTPRTIPTFVIDLCV